LSGFLLDTHTLLWAKSEPDKLSSRVHATASDPANAVYVSAASAYEIALKNRTGKLPGVEALVAGFPAVVVASGFQLLDITARHAITAGRLDLGHKDPFDRLLIAQALVEDLTLLSNERRFDSFGVRRLW
jgi:PIN domain nuclease of toxin-antitoxin system